MHKSETIVVGNFGKALAVILMTVLTGIGSLGLRVGWNMYDELKAISTKVTQLTASVQFIETHTKRLETELTYVKTQAHRFEVELERVKAKCEDVWKQWHGGSRRSN